MCCLGCQAIAQSIMDYGYADYYKYRTRHALTPELLVPEELRKLNVFDLPEVQKKFTKSINGHERETSLILEGVVCPACAWLNEKHLGALPGVTAVNVNYTSNRARVRWDDSLIHLSDILKAVTSIGYTAHPYEPGHDQLLFEKERKEQIMRIGLAGLLGMQVMMISVGLYIGEWSGIDDNVRKFFHWLNLLLTTPVLVYSAQPFFKGAWRYLRQLHAGMDVPVALGISIAYLGSVWGTLTDQGDVYYDAVVMFVFFLLTGRYFEFTARKKSREHAEDMNRALPAMATRLDMTAQICREELVPVAELRPGDRVLVRPGETIPADGMVSDGKSTVDESLVTGENLPVFKQKGTELIGGSTNVESPLHMTVRHIGADTILSQILCMIERAQNEKPGFTQLANTIAGWFVIAVLIITGLAAWYWWNIDQARWLPVTIAVLVATCPCALSLATPVAMTVAMTAYLKSGIALTRQDAVETLARATHFVFDKTGTLTLGKLSLDAIHCPGDHNENKCLALAAALERNSEHPVGKAIMARHPAGTHHATEVINYPGAGLAGVIDHRRYYIGTPDFIREHTGLTPDHNTSNLLANEWKTTIILADTERLHAVFIFSDEIRPQAKKLIADLKALGRKTILLSGDKKSGVEHVAAMLGIDTALSGLKPDDKLLYLKSLQGHNNVIAMIGDGINDAPVLAGADVSIAMGGGTSLARINADMILLNDDLSNLSRAVHTAIKTFAVIRQNIIWAISYNLLILPAAVAGLIMPWLAALGMSLSSLAVVGNATRLKN